MAEKVPPTNDANNRPWTSAELKRLREGAAGGARELAAELGRSVTSVTSAAYRHRISLRAAGERRGSVLGQPRGVSLQPELRHGALAGRVPESAIAARRELNAGPLCPACASREATHHSGYCLSCWHRELARRHHEELERIHAEDEARKLLWQERQRLHRERDRIAAGSGGPTDG